jgi:drug/metabolite transporter (DMT)-like permease
MSGRTIAGIALAVIGLFTLVYQGFTYTTRKKVVDIGPIQATKEEHHTVPLPPIFGALALVGGSFLSPLIDVQTRARMDSTSLRKSKWRIHL